MSDDDLETRIARLEALVAEADKQAKQHLDVFRMSRGGILRANRDRDELLNAHQTKILDLEERVARLERDARRPWWAR